jgi:hypothetical protein
MTQRCRGRAFGRVPARRESSAAPECWAAAATRAGCWAPAWSGRSGGPPLRRGCCPWSATPRASAGRAPAAAGPPSRRIPTAAAATRASGLCPGCRRRDDPCSTARPCTAVELAPPVLGGHPRARAGRSPRGAPSGSQPSALAPSPRHRCVSPRARRMRAARAESGTAQAGIYSCTKPISPRENSNFEFLSLIMLASS